MRGGAAFAVELLLSLEHGGRAQCFRHHRQEARETVELWSALGRVRTLAAAWRSPMKRL